MITYEYIFRNGRLDLRVEYKGVERFIPMQYNIKNSEWNPLAQRLAIPTENTARRRKLAGYEKSMIRDLNQMRRIVRELELQRGSRFTTDDIVNTYRSVAMGKQMLGTYASTLADELADQGQRRTARGYTGTVRRFVDFNNGYDIRLDDISWEMVTSFQQSLIAENLAPNTLSFYMRNLRAIYNKAISEGMIPMRLDNPFEDAYTDVYHRHSPMMKDVVSYGRKNRS